MLTFSAQARTRVNLRSHGIFGTIGTIFGSADGQWLPFRRGGPTNNLLNLTANYLADLGNASRAAG